MMIKKIIITGLIICFFAFYSFSQDQQTADSKFNLQSTFTNQLLWRSRPTTNALTIVPSVEYSTHGFTGGIWAAYAVNNTYKEVDFYLGYQWDFIDFWIFDYYNPTINTITDFSNFKLGETEHVFETKTTLRPIKSLGLKITAAIIFAGNDYKIKFSNDPNKFEYQQRYSSYFELGYDFKIGAVTLSPEIGLTPSESLYADKFRVFNYSLHLKKDIKITDHFNLPTNYTIAYNATLKQVFFSFGLTVRN